MSHKLKYLFAVICFLVLSFSKTASAKIVFLNDNIIIDPGTALSYPFLSAKKEGVRVTGQFRARGGSHNDIEVYIMDDIAYENFMNGNQAQTYYNSGRVTAGRINVFLPANKYFIVFNNKYSLITNKAVQVFIELD